MKPVIPLIALCLFMVSCRKEATSPAATLALNPTSYELISEIWSGPVTNGQSFFFTYDSAHLLTDYKRIQWGQGGYNTTDSGNIPTPGWTDTSYCHLEYSHGRVSLQYSIEGGAIGYLTYQYNDKGQLVKIATYDQNNRPEDGYVYWYSYNDKGQLTDMRQGNLPPYFYHYTFEYDGSGNLAREVDSTLYTQPVWIQIMEYSNYDNKVNFVKALNGFPTTFGGANNFGTGYSGSPNNCGTVSYFGSIQPGDPFGFLTTVYYTYQYNDQGLPVLIQSGPWTITLQYRKYK